MSLSLNAIVDINVYLSPLATVRKGFNIGLVIGNTPVIPASERIRTYYSTSEMLSDGFVAANPEYKAALLYFAQSPQPTVLQVGRRINTETFTKTATVTNGSAIITPASMSGIEVGQGVSGTGIPDDTTVSTVGTSTVTLSAEATADGTDVTLTFTPVNETWVEALQACRSKNSEWYVFVPCGVEKADIIAMAAEVEAMTPSTCMFYTTKDADVLAGTEGNVMLTLKGLDYRRSFGLYSTQHDYAAVSVMGYAMGANTGLANSAYDLCFKELPGVTVENITSTQYGYIVTNANGNVYVNRGDTYDMLQLGNVANGTAFDELINLDKLVNDLQLSAMDALYGVTKIPQTEDGMTYLINKLQEPLDNAVKIGFIAPGKWTGVNLLTLSTNDHLAKGYLIMSEAIADQSQSDREARKAPNIYIPIKLAGAIRSVVIGVYVNR
jgi:hypothetical protein